MIPVCPASGASLSSQAANVRRCSEIDSVAESMLAFLSLVYHRSTAVLSA
jgi:hypothetical protein